MAQLTVRINGYAYPVGCEDGQEAHLQAMAAEVDARIANIKEVAGPSGEARMLVLAALLMADELHDQALDLAKASGGKPPESPAAAASAEKKRAKRDVALAGTLGRLADRAEAIAAKLEAS